MKQLIKMAWRGLGRNRRRSLLSALALGIGVALLLFMASFIEGEMRSSLELSVKLETGHMQVRAIDYDPIKASLAWEDLVEAPGEIAAQIEALEPVKAASPRIHASGILLTGDESLGVRVIGLDPNAATSAHYSEDMTAGSWLSGDDREGVLIGRALSDKRDIGLGDEITLLINTANGDVDEQRFTVRGIFDTKTPMHDESNILMPLSKAQTISQAGDRASIVWVTLNDMFDSEQVAAAIQSSQYEVKTWQDLNQLQLQLEKYSGAMMAVFYLIVLGITATVVVNALVMAVFERTREIGVLAAIGMKGRRITALFLIESFMLAVGGVVIGLIVGGIACWWLAEYGIYFGSLASDMGASGFVLGERIYGYLTVRDAVMLVVVAFGVTLLASLYPARLAANMEPVEALHGGEA